MVDVSSKTPASRRPGGRAANRCAAPPCAVAASAALAAIVAGAMVAASLPAEAAQLAGRATGAPAGDCAVMRDYDDGTTMVLDANTPGRIFIGLTNPDFPVPALATGTVKMSVDDGLVYRLPAAPIPYGFVVEMKDDELTRALLRNGRWIDFSAVEELRYSLEGSAETLAAVFDCRRPAPPPAAPPAALAPPPAAGRYLAEMDTYARAGAAHEDWAALKKSLGARLAGYEAVMVPRARQSDGRRFHVMTVPGFAAKAEAEAFCQIFAERRRRCVVRPDGGG